jgi:hypothetical protein
VPTVVFYATVQLIEADAADRGEHNAGHPEREGYLRVTYGNPLADDYRNFRKFSELWRYFAREPTESDADSAWVRGQRIASGLGETWPASPPSKPPVSARP